MGELPPRWVVHRLIWRKPQLGCLVLQSHRINALIYDTAVNLVILGIHSRPTIASIEKTTTAKNIGKGAYEGIFTFQRRYYLIGWSMKIGISLWKPLDSVERRILLPPCCLPVAQPIHESFESWTNYLYKYSPLPLSGCTILMMGPRKRVLILPSSCAQQHANCKQNVLPTGPGTLFSCCRPKVQNPDSRSYLSI